MPSDTGSSTGSLSSSTSLTAVAIALMLPHPGSDFTPGQAQVPLLISNDDGSEPTVTYTDSALPAPVVTSSVAADPNGDGNYMLLLTAASVGTGTVTVLADGIANLLFDVTVTYEPDETVTAGPIQIVPPSPPTEAAASTAGTTAAGTTAVSGNSATGSAALSTGGTTSVG